MIFSHFVFSFFFIFFFVFFFARDGQEVRSKQKSDHRELQICYPRYAREQTSGGSRAQISMAFVSGRRRMPNRRLGPGRMQWTRAECTDRHCCVFFDRADRRHTTSQVSGWCSRSMKRGTPQRSRSLPHLHQILDLSPDVISSNTLTEGPGCLLGLNHLK